MSDETTYPDPTRARVKAAIQGVMDEAWLERDEPGALSRAHEIRKLAEEQLGDDSWLVERERVGSKRVAHHRDEDDGMKEFWYQRTEEQLALEAGLQPFLDQLPGDDRALLRWTHDLKLTTREMGKILHITHVGVQKRLKRIHERLRTELVKAFPEQPEGDK